MPSARPASKPISRSRSWSRRRRSPLRGLAPGGWGGGVTGAAPARARAPGLVADLPVDAQPTALLECPDRALGRLVELGRIRRRGRVEEIEHNEDAADLGDCRST